MACCKKNLLVEPLEPRRLLSVEIVTGFDSDPPPSQRVTEPVVLGSELVFAYTDRLLASDGTESGTRIIRNIPDAIAKREGSLGSDFYAGIGNLLVAGNLVFFTANAAGNGVELWRSDGTEAGTFVVKDINPGAASALETVSNDAMVALGDRVFFRAYEPTQGSELWTSDGTEIGTRRISATSNDNEPTSLMVFNDSVYFAADDKLHKVNAEATAASVIPNATGYRFTTYTIGGGKMLVRTTGYSRAQTHYATYVIDANDAVTSIGDLMGGDWDAGREGAYFNGKFYFRAESYANGLRDLHGGELWTSDGTAAGTVRFKDLVPGADDAEPRDFFVFRKRLYFVARHTENKWWLWRSDGTPDGTGALEPLVESPTTNYEAPTLASAIFNGNWHYTVHTPDATDVIARTAASGVGASALLSAESRTDKGEVQLHRHESFFPGYLTAAARFVQLGEVLYFSPGWGKELFRIHADGTTSRFAPLGPRAAMDSPTIAAAGQRLYTFDITFDGGSGGLLSGYDTFGAVVVKGPRGFSRAAAVIAVDGHALNFDDMNRRRTVTYGIIAPGGTWNSADRGRYTVWIAPDTIKGGVLSMPLTALGRFKVTGGDSTGASISGFVLNDHDADGMRDLRMPSEAVNSHDSPMTGVTVYLDADNDGVFDAGEASTVSDASGFYRFGNLAAGAYVVRPVAPAGWGQTNAALVHLLSGEWGRAHVLMAQYATVKGTIYDDRNDDGKGNDGDLPVEGVAVLLDRNMNGKRDGNERVVLTDANGKYSFRTFIGAYLLRLPWGIFEKRLTQYTFDKIAVGSGEIANFNFGATSTARLEARVYEDANGDSAFQSGEKAIVNAKVYVDLNGDGALQANEPSGVTGADGNALIRAVPAGTHVVRVAPLNDWIGSGDAQTVTLAPSGGGAARLGLLHPGRIHGTVSHDVNGNGYIEQGDAPLSGRVVFLDLNGNGNADANEPAATTDSAGRYQFIVHPGRYLVRQQSVSGWWSSSQGEWLVTAKSGGGYERNFLSTNISHITGQTFYDADRDGVFDADEVGYSHSLWIDLNNNGARDFGEPMQSSIFDEDQMGLWEFRLPNLPPGTYTLRIYLNGYTVTTPKSGAYTITVAPGKVTSGLLFGVFA